MEIGILGMQGDFLEHRLMIENLGAEVSIIRNPGQLDSVRGLVMPGGESTTIGMLMKEYGFDKAVPARVREGMAIFGTCAGMILLASEIVGRQSALHLGLIDLAVERNAYGRQVDSFETDINVKFLDSPFRAVFIRAPQIREARNGVEVLAEHKGRIIMARQNNILAASFHPELTDDDRIHRYFLSMCNC